MYEHLLVPVDGGDLSQKSMDHAIGLAKMLGARITGFTAEPPLPVMVVETAAVAYDVETFQEHERRCEEHARELLGGFAEQARHAGVEFDGQFVITDNVEQAIVDAAREHACDLIVMATHGRGAFGELLFGSQTKNVMARSKLPLLPDGPSTRSGPGRTKTLPLETNPNRADGLSDVVAMAGPDMLLRVGDHASTHRIQIEVRHARQQITIGLHQRGLVAPLPQRAATAMHCIEAAPQERVFTGNRRTDTPGCNPVHERFVFTCRLNGFNAVKPTLGRHLRNPERQDCDHNQ